MELGDWQKWDVQQRMEACLEEAEEIITKTLYKRKEKLSFTVDSPFEMMQIVIASNAVSITLANNLYLAYQKEF